MKKAFTLIELLIVVAIIAILAAIAVPNFLEAQVRAKTSRAKADMRSLATGMEAYRVDNNSYPLGNNFYLCGRRIDDPNEGADPGRLILERISTPTAYMTNSFIPDPFQPNFRRSSFSPATPQGANNTPFESLTNRALIPFLKYAAFDPLSATSGIADVEAAPGTEKAKAYHFTSSGPFRAYPALSGVYSSTDEPLNIAQFYDPTNGTVSYGYIIRAGGDNLNGAGGYASTFFKYAVQNK